MRVALLGIFVFFVVFGISVGANKYYNYYDAQQHNNKGTEIMAYFDEAPQDRVIDVKKEKKIAQAAYKEFLEASKNGFPSIELENAKEKFEMFVEAEVQLQMEKRRMLFNTHDNHQKPNNRHGGGFEP